MDKMYEITEEPLPETNSTMSVARSLDGTYIGTPDVAHMLCDKRGIMPEKARPGHGVCSIGFSAKDGKWYGWSHRAIYGFEIGSKVEKGDCAYTADNPEEMIDDYANFFADISKECADQHRAECQILPDQSGIRILHAPLKIPMANSLDEVADFLDGDENETLPEVDIHKDAITERKVGRGEWTAKTMEDARQMACDFAEGVG